MHSRRLQVSSKDALAFVIVPPELVGNGYGKRYYAPQPLTFDNDSFDSQYERTYSELYNYYRSKNYYNEAGYLSTDYKATYYDGYGYNFYNGNYGYYEFSRPPTEIKPGTWDFT